MKNIIFFISVLFISQATKGQINEFYLIDYPINSKLIIKNSNITELRVYGIDLNADSTLKILKVITRYDVNGNEIYERILDESDTTIVDEELFHKYNVKSELIESVSKSHHVFFFAFKTTYSYNKIGQLVSTCDYMKADSTGVFELDSCYNLTYDKKGNLKEIRSSNELVSTFELVDNVLIEYNRNGQLIAKYRNGKPIEKTRYSGGHFYLEYDSNSIVDKHMVEDSNNDTISVTNYYYKDGLMISNETINKKDKSRFGNIFEYKQQ